MGNLQNRANNYFKYVNIYTQDIYIRMRVHIYDVHGIYKYVWYDDKYILYVYTAHHFDGNMHIINLIYIVDFLINNNMVFV